MEIKQLLINLGLTKYETDAYMYILEHEIVEASEISKEAEIPYGKIYETLNKLEKYGFLEVQESRPKKYKTRFINIAVDDFLKQKRDTLNEEFNTFEKVGKQLLDAVERLDKVEEKERVFWRTAVGDEIHSLYETSIKEAKEEIFYFSPHSVNNLAIERAKTNHRHDHTKSLRQHTFLNALKEGIERGVSIKILYSGVSECTFFRQYYNPLLKKTEKNTQILIKAYQKETISPPLFLIDNQITIYDIVDPLDSHTTLGITKIYDIKLTNRIKEALNKIWRQSEKYLMIYPS